MKDLRIAKPKGYEKIIEEKRNLFNEINANQRKLENKAEIEKVALKAYEKGDVQPKRMVGGMSEVDRIKNSNNYADKDEGVPF